MSQTTRRRAAAATSSTTVTAGSAALEDRANSPRQLIEFADWAGVSDVEHKLLRRAHVHCKRHGLTLLSHKFRRGTVEKCSAVFCAIVVERLSDARSVD